MMMRRQHSIQRMGLTSLSSSICLSRLYGNLSCYWSGCYQLQFWIARTWLCPSFLPQVTQLSRSLSSCFRFFTERYFYPVCDQQVALLLLKKRVSIAFPTRMAFSYQSRPLNGKPVYGDWYFRLKLRGSSHILSLVAKEWIRTTIFPVVSPMPLGSIDMFASAP